MSTALDRVDHLVFAGADLREAVAAVEERFSARTMPGGRHPDWGTCNAILPIGPASYLEIIGPDPDASQVPTLFGIASLKRPRLVTWAAKGQNLAQLCDTARSHGVDLGAVLRGRRVINGGGELTWELTSPLAERAGGVIPFFIDWGHGLHPARSAKAEVSLLSLHARHPDPRRVSMELNGLGIRMDVETAKEPGLIAVLKTPRGEVTLS